MSNDYSLDFLRALPESARKRVIPTLPPEEQAKLIDGNEEYGIMVCRCETVTQAEVIEAIENPLGVTSLDAIKRRAAIDAWVKKGAQLSPRVASILRRAPAASSASASRYSRCSSSDARVYASQRALWSADDAWLPSGGATSVRSVMRIARVAVAQPGEWRTARFGGSRRERPWRRSPGS